MTAQQLPLPHPAPSETAPIAPPSSPSFDFDSAATDPAWSKFQPPLHSTTLLEPHSLLEPQSAASLELHASSPPAEPLIDLSWKKGPFRIIPYGAFWADMVYSTQRTSPGAFTLFVFSAQDQGEPDFEIDARRTRLGLDVTGPKLGTAETGGRVEIDFEGNFVTENRAGVLLRHAYWEAKDDRTRILVGQNWDVASPLLPNTVNYGTGWFGGNIGFRRTQFRAERFIPLSQSLLLTLQGSLNQDIVPDFLSEPGIRRESADWPVIQARVAFSLGANQPASRQTTLGFSGHIGETGFDFLVPGPPPLSLPPEDDTRFRTWSFNVDLYAPLSERTGFQGEFFTGANLSNFLGGIGQGVCPCLRRPIRASGGWFEFWYHPTAQQQFHIGAGVDDPNDKDTLLGRSSNLFVFVNGIRQITTALSTGLEISYWKTSFQETRFGLIPDDQLAPTQPGEAVTIDWMMKYEF